MTIVVSSISRCVGTNHVTIAGTVNSQAVSQTFMRSDLDLDPDDVQTAILARLRSAVKEANASTPAQIQTALVGKTFKV